MRDRDKCEWIQKSYLFSVCRTSEWRSIPLVIRWHPNECTSTSVWLRTYFTLKYQLQIDSVRLFAKHTPHKRMKANAVRLHIHIMRFACLCVRFAFAYRCGCSYTHIRTKRFANSSREACGKLIFHGPEANTGHTMYLIPFVFMQKTVKFWFLGNICKPFADSAAHVRSPIYTYAHLVCMCVPDFIG